ncbi:MAG: putative toxin-antitoxin system toxin component, PIN family [Actinomycetota bacterium]|nr:putative toxin-antitoxin system toxin component, PIN family [Actinomycetota bacterium]MDI6821519.1 putative toxin-antitoxin system toxin component, PIN family [Actinomycetota bacterium]
MAVRVVLDTNILLSGILFGGISGEILEHARKGKFTSVTSLYILQEFRRVAEGKFDLESNLVGNLIEEILSFSELIPVVDSKGSWAKDASDNPIIETAREGKAEMLVTGDVRLQKADGVGLKILSPKTFLETLSK